MIKATYIQHSGSDLTSVNAARISFANEKQVLDDKDKKLIKYLADNDHLSPFEHCSVTFLIECPLYIRSQIHRHRTFAYNEVSRRYTAENLEFYLPEINDVRVQSKSNKQASEGSLDENQAQRAINMMASVHETSLIMYENLIKLGVSREQARGVLPQNLMTKFYLTGNLRNLVHFIKLRKHHHSQKEVQYIAIQMEEKLKEIFPESMNALMNKK